MAINPRFDWRTLDALTAGLMPLACDTACVALQPLQFCAHFRRALVAQIPVFLKRGSNDFVEFWREQGIQLERGWRKPIQNSIKDGRGSVAFERKLAGRHLIEHRV